MSYMNMKGMISGLGVYGVCVAGLR